MIRPAACRRGSGCLLRAPAERAITLLQLDVAGVTTADIMESGLHEFLDLVSTSARLPNTTAVTAAVARGCASVLGSSA